MDADANALAELATELAPTLVGLTREQAQARVAGRPGLTLRLVDEGQPVTLEFRYGRITATVVDGVVTRAGVG